MRLYAINSLLKSAQQKLGVNLAHLNPLLDAQHCSIPAFFIHGSDDTLIDPSHMREIYEAYTGAPKVKHEVIGRHNCFRPDWIIEEACRFIASNLQGAKLKPAVDNSQLTLNALSKQLGPN